jgi:hypothetical protein
LLAVLGDCKGFFNINGFEGVPSVKDEMRGKKRRYTVTEFCSAVLANETPRFRR